MIVLDLVVLSIRTLTPLASEDQGISRWTDLKTTNKEEIKS